jgi:hypothetical protein
MFPVCGIRQSSNIFITRSIIEAKMTVSVENQAFDAFYSTTPTNSSISKTYRGRI